MRNSGLPRAAGPGLTNPAKQTVMQPQGGDEAVQDGPHGSCSRLLPPTVLPVYTHRMHRTQLYLDRAIHARLKALAKRGGLTVSQLVRDALELVYGSTQTGERLATLRGIAGLWRDREDGDADVYVRRLRRDTRRARSRS